MKHTDKSSKARDEEESALWTALENDDDEAVLEILYPDETETEKQVRISVIVGSDSGTIVGRHSG
jgi:hypothetical protein